MKSAAAIPVGGLVLSSAALCSASVGTAFTYQGHLKRHGRPAIGLFDLEFRLYDSPNGGAQIGGTQTECDEPVADGAVVVELDFGMGAFVGTPLWLEMGVQEAGGGGFTPGSGPVPRIEDLQPGGRARVANGRLRPAARR